MINRIYTDNMLIGKAMKQSYTIMPYDRNRGMVTLLGDPTLQINPQYKLQKPLEYLK